MICMLPLIMLVGLDGFTIATLKPGRYKMPDPAVIMARASCERKSPERPCPHRIYIGPTGHLTVFCTEDIK